MTARLAFLILTITCTGLTIVRDRVDGVTILAVIFALAMVAAPRQKATRK